MHLFFDKDGRFDSIAEVGPGDPEKLRAPDGRHEGWTIVEAPPGLEARIGVPLGDLLGRSRLDGDELVVDPIASLEAFERKKAQQEVSMRELQVAGALTAVAFVEETRGELLEHQADHRAVLEREWERLGAERDGLGSVQVPPALAALAGRGFRVR